MSAIDYDAWAERYDSTRGVSPSVLEALLEALGPAHGRPLLEIGGGTGDYSRALIDAGFRVLFTDFSPGMARQAAGKLLDAAALAVADGQRLPFRDATFDCAVAVKVLSHVPDWRRFLAEARRVLRAGPFVMCHATRETIAGNWIVHYVPSIAQQERFKPEVETVDALTWLGFRRVDVGRMHYRDMADGSAQALKHFPETFLDDAAIMNTSLISREPPEVRRRLLAAVRDDHRSGRLREIVARYEPLVERYGDGAVFVAWP